jgi:hypothetical protein
MPPIAQYVFNRIVTGGILELPDRGLLAALAAPALPNFAVSTYLTVGAYAALALNAGARAPLEAAWLGALLATGGVALTVDRIAFRPMRDRRPFSLAIASIGVGAQPAGLHERPRACRHAPSTRCAFGLGRSDELGRRQPSHQVGEIGEEIDALPPLDNLCIDEVDSPVNYRSGRISRRYASAV